MWYAICLGIGFAIGLGFLIWGLLERGKRTAAEKAVTALETHVAELEKSGKQAAVIVENVRADLNREHARTLVLRKALDEAQERLLKCDDPKTIREWLEAELKEQI